MPGRSICWLRTRCTVVRKHLEEVADGAGEPVERPDQPGVDAAAACIVNEEVNKEDVGFVPD